MLCYHHRWSSNISKFLIITSSPTQHHLRLPSSPSRCCSKMLNLFKFLHPRKLLPKVNVLAIILMLLLLEKNNNNNRKNKLKNTTMTIKIIIVTTATTLFLLLLLKNTLTKKKKNLHHVCAKNKIKFKLLLSLSLSLLIINTKKLWRKKIMCVYAFGDGEKNNSKCVSVDDACGFFRVSPNNNNKKVIKKKKKKAHRKEK